MFRSNTLVVLVALIASWTAFGVLPTSEADAGGGNPPPEPSEVPLVVYADAVVAGGDLVLQYCLTNKGGDSLTTTLTFEMEWPDGRKSKDAQRGFVLPGGLALCLLNVRMPIPAHAGSGEGSFTLTGVVKKIGESGRGKSYKGRLVASDSAPFVIP